MATHRNHFWFPFDRNILIQLCTSVFTVVAVVSATDGFIATGSKGSSEKAFVGNKVVIEM